MYFTLMKLIFFLCFPGVWGVGIATKNSNMNKVPLGTDADSWVLTHSGILMHNDEEKGKLPEAPQEGDVVVGLFCISVSVHM